jgi:hypothetical protein
LSLQSPPDNTDPPPPHAWVGTRPRADRFVQLFKDEPARAADAVLRREDAGRGVKKPARRGRRAQL